MPKNQGPKRLNTTKANTEAVQGKGSYAMVTEMTVGEAQDRTKREREDDFDATAFNMEVLKKHIEKWNWVDDDGKPLALPKDDANVLNSLTGREVMALLLPIFGQSQEEEEETKNS